MPSEDVELLEARYPGYLAARLKLNTSFIYARLAKRYAVPFAAPAPEIVLGWLTAMTTTDAYRKRGWNPGDEQSAQVEQDRKDALDQMKEAADEDNGLFDLPLREDTSASGISRGTPLGYSEVSAYDWIDIEAEALRGR